MLRYETYRWLKSIGFSGVTPQVTLSEFDMEMIFCPPLPPGVADMGMERIVDVWTSDVTLVLPPQAVESIKAWENYELIT